MCDKNSCDRHIEQRERSSDTADTPRVIGVHGAVEQHESARHALDQALKGATNAGAATDFLDLSELALPLYDPDYSGASDAAVVTHRIAQADAVLLATSVRHNSYSTQLKNALEYCGTDEFDGTPVGLLGIANTSEPTTALDHLRTICTMLDAQVLTSVSLSTETIREERGLPADSVSELRTLGNHVATSI